jgi:Flp pilus assembly protein TadD
LGKAVELDPDNPRYAYVQGVALNSAGQSAQAVAVLTQAQQRHPNDAELMFALATIERDRGQTAQAVAWAQRMLARNPTDTRAQQLLQALGVDSP